MYSNIQHSDFPHLVNAEAVPGNRRVPVQSRDGADAGDRHHRNMELEAAHSGGAQAQERRLSGWFEYFLV